MKKVTATVTLPCTPEKFWSIYLDQTYAKGLYLEELKFKDYTVLEQTADARKQRIVPKINLPGPIASLVGESFAYEEHGALDRPSGVWSWRMVQPKNVSAKPFLTTSGSTRVVADGEGRCRRTDEVNIEAKMFGIGGLIESTVEKEVRASWAKETAYFPRWLQSHA